MFVPHKQAVHTGASDQYQDLIKKTLAKRMSSTHRVTLAQGNDAGAGNDTITGGAVG